MWTSRIPAIQAGMVPKAQAAVTKAAMDIEAHAKGVAPVDTGNLRASIQARPVGSLHAEVHAQASYSVFVEYGTYKMGAQPFMTPAANTVAPGFAAAIARCVG